MPTSRTLRLFVVMFMLVAATACKTPMELAPVDYSMLLETVLTPDESGRVIDRGYGVSFSVRPVQFMEAGDSLNVAAEYRFIRDKDGFYYLTAAGYRNVYIFKPNAAKLTLHKQVPVSPAGLRQPAFNQRNPVIQLIDGESLLHILTKDGISGAQ